MLQSSQCIHYGEVGKRSEPETKYELVSLLPCCYLRQLNRSRVEGDEISMLVKRIRCLEWIGWGNHKLGCEDVHGSVGDKIKSPAFFYIYIYIDIDCLCNLMRKNAHSSGAAYLSLTKRNIFHMKDQQVLEKNISKIAKRTRMFFIVFWLPELDSLQD